jgi:hypothetical protein
MSPDGNTQIGAVQRAENGALCVSEVFGRRLRPAVLVLRLDIKEVLYYMYMMGTTPKNASPVPAIALTHGQARWVLSHLGLRTAGGAGSFDNYLKYLRRAGLPFASEELGSGRGNYLSYGYQHLMELAVALALRTQAILPGDVVALLAAHRDELRPIYRRAYEERDSGLGASIRVELEGGGSLTASGVYLDLALRYEPHGPLVMRGPGRSARRRRSKSSSARAGPNTPACRSRSPSWRRPW